MTRLSLSSTFLVALSVASAAARSASAEDTAGQPPATAAADTWSWTGGYFGAHVGTAWGKTIFSDPFASSLYGDDVNTPTFLFGGQIGLNWQVPGERWVFGAEADISHLISDGTNTCLAYSGFFISANCRVQPQMMTTLTGRVGFAAGPHERSLFYLKGGLAGVLDTIDVATNSRLPPRVASTSQWKWGGTIGAGIEHALAPAWSLKFEYDYLNFASSTVPTPGSFVQAAPPKATYNSTAPGTSSVSQSLHMVKLGLNYRFGMDPRASWPTSSGGGHSGGGMPPGWEAELGGRAWFSSGRFQKDFGRSTIPAEASVLSSRLTYNTSAASGEFFGRVESPWNIFLKGFMGAGGISTGSLYDEDWGTLDAAYSNTLSSVTGTIEYATLDLGYDIFRGRDHKLGVFVGYNYYTESKAGYGCAQFANQFSDCQSWLPNSVLTVTEDTTWRSLRLGVNGEIGLFDSLRLSADVAYLPYVRYDSTDNHVLRGFVSPEWGHGNGAQLETILSYDLTPEFSIGVGGRYWAMWTTDAYIAFAGFACPCRTLPTRAERYGVFVQASFRFAQPDADASQD